MKERIHTILAVLTWVLIAGALYVMKLLIVKAVLAP